MTTQIIVESHEQKTIYEVPIDFFIHCARHGDFCVNAYYDENDIKEMIESGEWHCPECLREVCNE
jgi:hypothetical protein